LFKESCKYGWTLQAYLYTLRPSPQKNDLNEFIDRFKLFPICIRSSFYKKNMEKQLYGHYKIIFYTLIVQKLCQYQKWLYVIVCVLILTKVDKVIATNRIVSMRDEI
jgi:hypothetical protein